MLPKENKKKKKKETLGKKKMALPSNLSVGNTLQWWQWHGANITTSSPQTFNL